MIPNKTGIWEWFPESEPSKSLRVYVWNVFERYPNQTPHFRVYWRGGYYDVSPDGQDTESIKRFNEAGWSNGTWGNYLGDYEDFNEEELY